MIISSMPVLAEDDWENIFGDFENFDIADAEEGEVIDVAPTPIVVNETYYDVDDSISDNKITKERSQYCH